MNPNSRWIALTYFVMGLLLWILLDKFMSTIMFWVGVDQYNFELLSSRFTLTTLVGLIISLAVTIYCYRHPVISTLSNEVLVELKKVTWPSALETRSATVVVIITVFIMSFILGIFDLFWSKLLKMIYPSVLSG